jgi:hypothetical protein
MDTDASVAAKRAETFADDERTPSSAYSRYETKRPDADRRATGYASRTGKVRESRILLSKPLLGRRAGGLIFRWVWAERLRRRL